MMRRRAPVAVVLAIALIAGCRRADERAVTIVTTPDLAGIGFVESLARTFAASSNVPTHVLVTEERLIPGLVREGVADVVITRSRRGSPGAPVGSGRPSMSAGIGTPAMARNVGARSTCPTGSLISAAAIDACAGAGRQMNGTWSRDVT